jgi:CheY-like chemotaxis protein
VPAELETDKQRLRQILNNLLSNAVKFTEHGHVVLRIDMLSPQQPGAGPQVVFSVTDTGIGISRDNFTSIFSAFQQGDGTTSRRYGGTGLGLAICREVAVQLGGDVTVESELGAGSTFSLYLPLPAQTLGQASTTQDAPRLEQPGGTDGQPAGGAASPAPAFRPVPPAGRHEALRGRKVLVVDDDPRNAFVLTDVLQLHGMTVVEAGDGRRAIAELDASQFDIVLMDVMMPEMDGHETTRTIRQLPHHADLPVIAVTARAMQGDRQKALDAGATDYITKPIDIEELLNCMERWLTPRR